MPRLLAIASLAAVLFGSTATDAAERIELNRLDCMFSDAQAGFICPPRQNASAPEMSEAVLLAQAAPPVGTEEWSAWCASRYRSFDPQTGTYTAFSGETRECR
jgi:hypothetical protein